MTEKWNESTIGNIGRVVTGKTPPTSDPENYGGTLPFITPSDMKGQKFIGSTERTISVKGIKHVKNLLIPPKTVFVSCIGSDMGKVGMTTVESVTNQQINAVIVNEGVDTNYVYYNLFARKDELQRLATSGSAQPILNKGHFSQLKIEIPPLPEQKAIASILGALDDKIELNRKMNETLEAMARTIFKSWFMDFDPIPGFGPHKDWQDSPLGKIPKGWKVAQVSKAFEINPIRQIKKGIQYTHVDMQSLPTTSARVTNITRREFTGSGSKFKNGDVLFARITPCLENGKTALVDFLPENEYGWGSTEFIVFGPKELLNSWFVYCVARNQEFRDHAIRAMSGTSGRQRVEIGCFNNFSIVIPPAEITTKFANVVKPWFTQMKTNDEESHTLATIRDTLLTKLLSGEIRVKDAERFVAEKRSEEPRTKSIY